jgi:hypothetical protein
MLNLFNNMLNILNSTCGLDGKPCHGENPITDDSPSAINTPDVAMAGVARHHDRFMSQVREKGEEKRENMLFIGCLYGC